MYAFCRTLLGPVVVSLILTCGAAHAGAWEEFEQRCLLAYEHDVPAITKGLTKVDLPGLQDNEIAFSGLTGGALMILEDQPTDGFSACKVFFSQADEANLFRSWVETQRAETRYVDDDVTGNEADIALVSHLWIEPVIAVQLRQLRGGHELRVVQTELES